MAKEGLSSSGIESGRRQPREEHPGGGGTSDAPILRQNPCAPETVPDDCDCPKPPAHRDTPKRPERPAPRKDDCCDQLLDLLRAVPGLELPQPRKPKQRPARKVQALCDALGIADAILPATAVLWERFREGSDGRNEFEDQVQKVFVNLSAKQQDAMEAGFAGYRKMRESGKGECLFNDCLADAAREGPLEKSWFTEELLREGLKFAGHTVFGNSGGMIGPGQVRLWDNKVFHGPNGSGATIYQGPWPWLTAICTNLSGYQEYGNLVSFKPAPGTTHLWQNYQYAQTCTYKPDPGGKIQASCEREHPAPPPPGGMFAGYCEGGREYTHGNDCLRIPAQRAGGSIKLRGFNFITPTVKVRMTLTTDTSISFEEVCAVWGDTKTPLKDSDDHYIVDERVSDWVDFPIRSSHPKQPGAPLPPGIYEISVHVANVTNALYDGSTPPMLVSNKLLIRIEPDVNVRYLLWSERGRCNRETPGWGDDEIWWDAFVGHIVPTEVPVPTTGTSPLEIKSLDRKEFPRGPWEDMDDGEAAGAYNRDIFGPAAFELYGVAVVGLVGFEVDSESAARDQLQGFGNAFGEALKSIVLVAVSGEGLAGTLAKIAGATLTQAIIVLVIVAVVVLICAVFWASWAPADLIALDLFVLDAFNAWERTDPGKPLPAETARFFDDETGRESMAATGSRLIMVKERALPKLHKPGDAAATWIQENEYEAFDEDANYTLEFRIARS